MVPPAGATGLVDACGAAEGPLHLSVDYGLLDTDLNFSGPTTGATQAHLVEQTLTVGLGYRINAKTSLTLGLGGLAAGQVTEVDGVHSLRDGWVWSATVSRVLLSGGGWTPVISASASLAELSALAHAPGGTNDPGFTALDIRLGVTVGETFFQRLTPYLGASAFGGPVLWQYAGDNVVGTDAYHFQVLAGLQLALPGGFEIGVEGSPLGDCAVSAGVGFRP